MGIRSDSVKEWRKRTKHRMAEAFGGSCGLCGYNRCDEALAFHHLDPAKKDFSIGGVLKNPKAWDKIVIELRKCILLCNNCHAEVHYGVQQVRSDMPKFDEGFAEYRVPQNMYQEKKCICGTKLLITHINYCSYECAGKASWSVDWDNIDLGSLYKEHPVVKIAEILGLSDAAVHKRLKKLNLK